MPDTYKLQYDGMTLTYPGWNGCVSYEAQSFKTLTLLNSEGGTLTANTLTGYPGDTINLSTAYNTYWRFSGYQLTGDGSLVGNDYTFGTEDATICACFKPNAFTASGGFEKGSDITKSQADPWYVTMYILHGSHTGDIPASWYSTSNRWHPSNASAYNINIHGAMKFSCTTNGDRRNGSKTVCIFAGSNMYQTQTYGNGRGETNTYTANQSLTTQNVYYGVSAKLQCSNYMNRSYYNINYIANGTTGTWTATGYAP